MACNLVADRACCGLSLRSACIGIAIVFLILIGLSVIMQLGVITLVVFLVNLIGNLSLLFGALKSSPWLVFVWLINAAIIFICWPIVFFVVVVDYGDYRKTPYYESKNLFVLELIVELLIMLYCTHLVYSFFHQLRKSETEAEEVVGI